VIPPLISKLLCAGQLTIGPSLPKILSLTWFFGLEYARISPLSLLKNMKVLVYSSFSLFSLLRDWKTVLVPFFLRTPLTYVLHCVTTC